MARDRRRKPDGAGGGKRGERADRPAPENRGFVDDRVGVDGSADREGNMRRTSHGPAASTDAAAGCAVISSAASKSSASPRGEKSELGHQVETRSTERASRIYKHRLNKVRMPDPDRSSQSRHILALDASDPVVDYLCYLR